MITLKEVTIHKYKCIENGQTFNIDDGITILVGMNESGKTSILEALSKGNYFEVDQDFMFNATHDYPRREKKKMDRSGIVPNAVTFKYSISSELTQQINNDLGQDIFSENQFSVKVNYENKKTVLGIEPNIKEFYAQETKELRISNDTIIDSLMKSNSIQDIEKLASDCDDDNVNAVLDRLKKYFENEYKWHNPIGEYIYRTHLKPNIPKFLYYSEYYTLPSRISIEKLQNEQLETEELKTAKALFELADIKIGDLIQSDSYETFKAELEATQATITAEVFEYWSTNKNLEIEFGIDKRVVEDPHKGKTIAEHILDIRVRNNRAKVSLPLKNRSRGFNWFFSFLVWFKKIQEDRTSKFILLLDEPGLNLHASAQSDLLRFIEYLAKEYQIIYTTHSPFMVEPIHLERVRTIVQTDDGSTISDSIYEKDPNTLFPLQAALGYDIAQNLFISKNNLLVEGVSDLIYLQIMSALLQEMGKASLLDDITIVPVGGLDKVSTFVSLLRGNKLNMVCLLDSSIDASSKAKLDNLIKNKIIQEKKILFYDEFLQDYNEADIEDMFSKTEYLEIFNTAFGEHNDIRESDLNPQIRRIVLQINEYLKIDRFNHYRPANTLAKRGIKQAQFSNETIDNFEKLFKKVNSILK